MWCLKKRYFVTLMAFFQMFLLFFVRINMGIAVVAMTSNTTVTVGNETKIIPAEFHWTSMEKGLIFSAINCGALLSFLAGLVVHKIGGSRMTGVSTLLAGIIELLSPLILRLPLIAILVARAAMGLLEAFTLVGITDIFARWAPQTERTRLITIATVGHMVSGAVNYPLTGYLVYTFGWQSIFYVAGTIILIWSVIWLCFVANDPAADKFISEAERNYLKSNTIQVPDAKVSVPWRSILSSRSVYVLLNEFLSGSWASSFVSQLLPLYLKDAHNMNIKDLGLMAGLPMICNAITLPTFGYLADYLRSGRLSIGKFHKIYIFLGQFLTLIFLSITVIWGNFAVCLICFCLIRMAYSLSSTSYQVISIDMAGQYAGVLSSMTRSVFKIGHVLNPLVVACIVQNHSPSEWRLYFIFLSVISMYGVLVFLIFGSAETQPWAVSPPARDSADQSSETRIAAEK